MLVMKLHSRDKALDKEDDGLIANIRCRNFASGNDD